MKKSSTRKAPEIKRAVYAGSFDPVTNGHLWMVEKGSELFDELVVAVGINPDKECAFSIKERMGMLRELLEYLPNVRVASYKNNLVDFAREIGANYLLRGIRSDEDYEYEKEMRYTNSNLNPDITTIFLISPKEISEVSSSKVRDLIGQKDWKQKVKDFIPEPIHSKLLRKFGK